MDKIVATAIETGFARARSAILDGNITTLIAAAVLGLTRFRYRKRICFYISDRYYPFNVYLYGSYEGADACSLCDRCP